MEKEYWPTGLTCCECIHRYRKCNHLPFHEMRIIKKHKDDGSFEVRCSDYTKGEPTKHWFLAMMDFIYNKYSYEIK